MPEEGTVIMKHFDDWLTGPGAADMMLGTAQRSLGSRTSRPSPPLFDVSNEFLITVSTPSVFDKAL